MLEDELTTSPLAEIMHQHEADMLAAIPGEDTGVPVIDPDNGSLLDKALGAMKVSYPLSPATALTQAQADRILVAIAEAKRDILKEISDTRNAIQGDLIEMATFLEQRLYLAAGGPLAENHNRSVLLFARAGEEMKKANEAQRITPA